MGVDNIRFDMPPLTAQHYEYEPRPVDTTPPIGNEWLLHFFKYPAACGPDEWRLKQFAKRIDGPALPNQRPDHRIGWGIHLEERFDWLWMLIYFGLGVASSTVFGVSWAVVKGSIQDGFSVGAFIITVEALAVATLQTA